MTFIKHESKFNVILKIILIYLVLLIRFYMIGEGLLEKLLTCLYTYVNILMKCDLVVLFSSLCQGKPTHIF